MAKAKAGPVVSDNGNFIIDAPFPEDLMKDPYTVPWLLPCRSVTGADRYYIQLLTRIKMLTGVVEVGLFCHMAKSAYFGNQDGSVTIKWHDGKIERVDESASPLPDKE